MKPDLLNKSKAEFLARFVCKWMWIKLVELVIFSSNKTSSMALLNRHGLKWSKFIKNLIKINSVIFTSCQIPSFHRRKLVCQRFLYFRCCKLVDNHYWKLRRRLPSVLCPTQKLFLFCLKIFKTIWWKFILSFINLTPTGHRKGLLNKIIVASWRITRQANWADVRCKANVIRQS